MRYELCKHSENKKETDDEKIEKNNNNNENEINIINVNDNNKSTPKEIDITLHSFDDLLIERHKHVCIKKE